jgi:uncharacterized RDD family membrane protein YckC
MSTPLVTGEAVTLELRTAAVPSRLLAAAIDGAVQGALLLGLFLLAGLTAGGGSGAAAAAVVVVAVVLAGVVYPVTFETVTRGRTLGKLALGLRVVRDDAGPIGFRQAFVRGLVGFFVERPGITMGSAALLSSLLSESGKRLGDLAAGTVVVQERVARVQESALHMPAGLAGWATTLDLTGVREETAQSARAYLDRFGHLTPAVQASLGAQIAAALRAQVPTPPPGGTPDWVYVTAVLAERRQRADAARHAAAQQEARLPGPTVAPLPSTPAPPGLPPTDPPPSPGGFALPG